MKRRRQGSRAQTARRSVAREHERIEALLFAQRAPHADALDERDESIAAVQKHVLPVVDLTSADFERGCATAQEPRALEDLDVIAPIAQIERGREPREAGSDNRYTPSQARTIAPIFSVLESPARRCNGNVGSRSIFSRMRS